MLLSGRRCVAGLILGVLFMTPGCGMHEARLQADKIGDAGTIRGTVAVRSEQSGPVIVQRYATKGELLLLESHVIASSSGRYQFTVAPGEYRLLAFIDGNGDGKFQSTLEHGSVSMDLPVIVVGPGQVAEVKPIVIRGFAQAPPDFDNVIENRPAIILNIGKVVSLDDPQFTHDNYAMGMWHPIDFLDEVGGGLLFLERYDPDRIPVLFVHGMGGGPTDLRSLIDSIDKRRFQAWILYYPSGLRLDMISDYLVNAVTDLQNRFGFSRMNVVGHSMGGLIARSFVKKYVDRFPRRLHDIGLVITINTPIGGLPRARSAIDISPFVVPSWRDVAGSSEFLTELREWSWPREIPYYLMFSYEDGTDGDGLVGLDSQIPLDIQSEATRMYGFRNTHVGVLQDESFIQLFGELLANQPH